MDQLEALKYIFRDELQENDGIGTIYCNGRETKFNLSDCSIINPIKEYFDVYTYILSLDETDTISKYYEVAEIDKITYKDFIEWKNKQNKNITKLEGKSGRDYFENK